MINKNIYQIKKEDIITIEMTFVNAFLEKVKEVRALFNIFIPVNIKAAKYLKT